MCKRLFFLVSIVFLLGSVIQAEDIEWTDLGADHLWSTPENWSLGRVPTLDDEVRIDVPAAAAPNGPVIQDGIDAKAKGIFTEAAGEPTLTITGGTLEVAEWIWWGDGENSFAILDMSGGSITTGSEFELGWGGGAGTLTMTGGSISVAEGVIPTGSAAFGQLYLYGGTYDVTNAGGLSVNENGLIDITKGTLVLEGDDTAKVNDLIVAGLITAYGSNGTFELDFDVRNPGKTTLTATIEKAVLFSEDFEGLTLGPNVDEALAGEAVWTDTPPEGWIVDESGIPGLGLDATDGVTEWAGWAFADKAWWTETAGDQRRSEFTLGQGTVAVADPDEWDDDERLPIPISADPYDTWLTTPAIDIADAEPGTLELKFDSSWRPEFDDDYHQTATITASYDGGEPIEVLRWESDSGSTNFKDDNSTNDTIVIDLQNPEGARKVVLTFGLFDAGNDWWWAIDNIEVLGVVPDLGPVKPSTEGLVAYYALNGDATDSSGNGLDGTLVGDPAFVEGQVGMALELDGDDYVDCGNPPELMITDAISIACWVNPAQLGGEQGFAGLDAGYSFKAHGEGVRFTTPGILDHSSANLTLEAGVWQHVAATFQPGLDEGLVFYLNGNETERITSSAINVGSGPFRIGNNQWNEFLTGLIDEVMIYNRILSEAEIRYLAGERATPVDPGSNGLLARWACDEGEGTIVADVSGNGRDGMFVNGNPAWVEGVLGSAVELVGPTLIETPPLDLELTEATMAGWILPYGAQPDWSSIIMQRDPGLATGFNVLGYQLAYHWNDTSDSWSFRGGDMIAEDDWTFAAVTIEPDKATFYVNGEQGSVNEVTHEPCLWNSNVYLGGDGTDGFVGRRMIGALDEVVIYDRALSYGEIRYLAGIREFEYDGGELDDTWDHDNGSDAWDGTGPGEGNPGGAVSLTEDDVTFLRIQDTGDPRSLGISDPSNRKVYFTRLTDISLDGLHIEARIRVATTPPLDNQLSGDPWPAEGIGYHIRDGGKGMIGVSDGVGIISFSLGQAGEADYPDAASDLLVMNNLAGTEPSGNVDTGEGDLNAITVEDATQWNTLMIDIVAGGAGTHIVTVSVNGGPAESFDVTLGDGTEAEAPYITIGSSGTGGITAFDVDYLSVSN